MNVIGWDIGGANIKASDGADLSLERAFALWKTPERLVDAIGTLSQEFRKANVWAVSMTGELADCYQTKREGVSKILQSVFQAASGTPLAVWTTVGEFVPIDDAIEWPLLTAASNWQALATWIGRMVPNGTALMIDVGSTTTDIIPLVDGFPEPTGRTDLERLCSGELVYTGSRRTPVAAIVDDVVLNGVPCPVAAELFATALDVHVLTGHVEESNDCDTANGLPATRRFAYDRLARMVCCDRDELDLAVVTDMARQIADRQIAIVAKAINRVAARLPTSPRQVVLSGSGEFLARLAFERSGLSSNSTEICSLSKILGQNHATAACAFALARLGQERIAVDVADRPGDQ